jgi:hypothetical protein
MAHSLQKQVTIVQKKCNSLAKRPHWGSLPPSLSSIAWSRPATRQHNEQAVDSVHVELSLKVSQKRYTRVTTTRLRCDAFPPSNAEASKVNQSNGQVDRNCGTQFSLIVTYDAEQRNKRSMRCCWVLLGDVRPQHGTFVHLGQSEQHYQRQAGRRQAAIKRQCTWYNACKVHAWRAAVAVTWCGGMTKVKIL